MRSIPTCAAAVSRGQTAAVILAALIVAAPATAQAQDVPAGGVASDIARYCSNIADKARDQRYMIQKKKLEDLQSGIDARMKDLDAKRAEYEDWLTRRNKFLEVAQEGLVDIYAKMDADAAASQLELINPNIAAAVIMKLQPNKASSILNEMKAAKAAILAGIIASAGDPTTSRNPT